MSRISKDIVWSRVIVEGAVIVASILLALGLDAWWTERVERSDEREQLGRLHTEFAENRARIGGLPNRIASASSDLLDTLSVYAGRAESIALSDTLLLSITLTPTFDPVTPVLDGLIRSGRLEIIRSQPVRVAIATWERTLDELVGWELSARSFTETQLVPGLTSRGDVAHILADRAPYRPRTIDPAGTTPIRMDEQLKGLIGARVSNAEDIVYMRSRLRLVVDTLLVTITRAHTTER